MLQTKASHRNRRGIQRGFSLIVASLVLVAASLLSPLSYQPALAEEAGTDIVRKIHLPTIRKQLPGCFEKYDPTIFGVQRYGNTGSKSEFYDAMISTGADWIRVPIRWSDVEPVNTSPATYRWFQADAAVAAAIDACKRVIITHRAAPDWAAEYPESVINRANEQDFAEYIRDLAERYDGDGRADAPGAPVVLYWEIYNEPDASDDNPGVEAWGHDPAAYARVLALAYDGIKAANPNAKVLFGGIASDWFEEDGGPFVRSFLDDVLAIDKGQHFDIFNYHSYPAFSPKWIRLINPGCVSDNTCEGPGLLEKNQYMVETMRKHNIIGKDIIITESGWHSDRAPGEPSTEEYQARYVTELFVQSKAAGVEAMIFFSLVDPDLSPYDYGLFTNPTTPGGTPRAKKGFYAYTAALEWLGEATFVKRLTQQELNVPSMDAYKFLDKEGNTFYVAWLNPADMGIDLNGDGQPDTKAEFESLRLLHNRAQVYDIYGTPTATVQDNDGDIRILIGAQPSYIRITD